ncbi:MAG: septum formation protein Maf [Neptuniibacter caesariensis]|uniref:dTTP/UTP pyrophosphatase n=1 Tax=Neptuniibacter caesariensis TaxID=207954 RepID=A0A2G6JKN1_NEPCE|nr:MAG: septum formation protein Maf [Neptuniibacter caesariensis]
MELILASASPRRRELLSQIGVAHRVYPVDICEDVIAGETAAQYVERLALEKAEKCAELTGAGCAILGSDTTVVAHGRILGKPADKEDAVQTLLSLSGKVHEVITGVALVTAEQSLTSVVKTEVRFRALSRAECERYWETGEPRDKAGSYGIQGLGAIFVDEIKGSYSSVVGLPLTETARLLSKVNVPVWQSDRS